MALKAWSVRESVFGHYYHTLEQPAESFKVLWTYADREVAKIACRSLNQKRMASRTAAGKPFSYFDGKQIQTNGL